MSNNKRKVDRAEIEPTAEYAYIRDKNSERNLRRRIAYNEMAPEKKAALLERRRAEYAARKRRHSENSAANHSAESCSSAEPRRKIPRHAATFISDKPCLPVEVAGVNKASATPSNETSNDCFSMFEIGSTSGTSNEQYNLRQSTDTKGHKSTHARLGCWNINQLPDSPAVLKKVPNCSFCKARRFQYEPPASCCNNGSVKLVSHKLPPELRSLYFGTTDESNHFRTYIRTYNNMFAFTSLGVKYDKELAKRTQGIYTFRVQGQMYHFITNLNPTDNKVKNLQIYFYDNDNDIVDKMAFSEKLDKSVISKLIDILKVNPYSMFLKSLTGIPDLSNFYIALKCDSTVDQRTYNLPTVSEVAAIWVDEDNIPSTPHIRVYTHSNSNQLVHYYYGCYDPLQYPLLFPYGENGWHCGIQKVMQKSSNPRNRSSCKNEQLPSVANMCSIDGLLYMEAEMLQKEKRKRNTVSCREYYCYKLQIRDDEDNEILHSGRLFQQYTVDEFIKIETQRLDFLLFNQDLFRIEMLEGLLDLLRQGEREASTIGKKTFLPDSFTGGPRDMRRRYMDAITLVQHFGKPDIFLTMTCNPSWPEIEDLLLSTDEVQNRPDLISRVFKAKVEELKSDIIKKSIFGKVAALMYTIEFQKRGLPHAHFLIILVDEFKLLTPEAYDKVVCAELPDEDTDYYLHSLVKKHMMHGPCGSLNPTCPCMKKGQCKFKYPKNYAAETSKGKNSYPIYRRRDTGKFVKIRSHFLDNSWVVPYNRYLLSKFNCHINVEICSDVKVVKYLYKYICKGHDKITFNVHSNDTNTEIDEIREYQSARWLSPPEATWRLFSFPISEMNPSVYRLQLHLKGQQFVSFKKTITLSTIVNNPGIKRTMLTEFFEMNATNQHAIELNLLYKEFPEYFVWSPNDKMWTRRKQGKVIGRIVTCHPTEGERYYLRLLLMNIRGPKSFDDLKFVDGICYNTYRESAEKRGLLASDNNLIECMLEAANYQMPYSLRRLFATILVYCNPTNPKEIWERFESSMSEDFTNIPNIQLNNIRYLVLNHINDILHSMGHNINEFKLISENINSFTSLTISQEARDIHLERNITVTEEELLLYKKLNKEQQTAYDTILNRIFSNKAGAFFVDGPGGTGKSFLYRALLATVRSKGFIALATATSGVAASVLPGGRTAHSRFKLPIDITENCSCNISKQSSLASLIRDAKLIVWDEVTMARKKLVETFDLLLRDLMDINAPFGGKVVVFGGDFRQTLPVVQSGKKEDFIHESLLNSDIWSYLEKFRLTENMRARTDPTFCDYLLRIGDGKEKVDKHGKIKIPESFLIPFTNEKESLNILFKTIYPNLDTLICDTSSITSRAILTTKNDFVNEINQMFIDQFPNSATTFVGIDETIEPKDQSQFEDFLHTLNPAGLPPYKLVLKKNCPVMLLRNLNPSEGLCNGTRLICTDIKNHVISAKIASGDFKDKHVFIPRIPLLSSQEEKFPIPFKRTQFPIRLCFAMTINKAQGQTLDFVGIYLREPVFSHGQLYVALSRAESSDGVKMLIRPATMDNDDDHSTYNVVYSEIIKKAFS